MIRVLIDYHHSDLFESYRLLFEDRFGWKVIRPIGMEWFDEGYWQFEKKWHGDAVARQYLQLWGDDITIGNAVFREDKTHPGRIHEMLTLGAARDLKPDIVISSVPDNDPGLYRFAKEVGAHFGVQIGNQWQETDWERAEFGLISATLPVLPIKPHVTYHQEFRLEDFRYDPPLTFGPVRSFVNCFQEAPEYQQFLPLARSIQDFEWEVYGAPGSGEVDEFTKGNLPTTPDVAYAMRGAGIIWHAKHWSDGFGHVVHNAFAVGRPVFGYQQYYKDKLAGPLWIDGVTSWDVGTHAYGENVAKMRELRADADTHQRMCAAAAARFREVVNFDEDAEKVKRMFEKVL